VEVLFIVAARPGGDRGA